MGGSREHNRSAADDSTRKGATRNLISISPFFIVKDLQASVAFYRERLGFQLDFEGPDGDGYVLAFFQLRGTSG